jgi:hypothetical protein
MGLLTDKYPKMKWVVDLIFFGLFIILIISAQSAYNMGLKNGIIYCQSRCALCPADMNEDISIPNVCKCENETVKEYSVENLSYPLFK